MSFSVAALLLISVFLFVHPVFMTIDDSRLKYIYAGYSTGSPTSLYLFCYYPLSGILSKLYSLFPQLPWYAIYQFGTIGFASGIIGKTIYKICQKKRIPWFLAVLFHIAYYLGTCLISTVLMHFEITAAMIGSAGVACFLGMNVRKDSRATQIVDYTVSALCLIFCFIIQFNAFYSVACYLLVAIVVKFITGLKGDKKSYMNIVILVSALVTLIVAVKIQDKYLKSTDSWQSYLAYNKYRVSFWDYPHTTYEEDPDLFEELGWSKEFYDLTESMYFMDPRFNKENLSKFTKPFSWFSYSDAESLKTCLHDQLSSLFRSERFPLVQSCLLGFFLFYVIYLLAWHKWREYQPQIIGLLLDSFGTIILVALLAARGRLPLRAWLMSLIPSVTIGLLMILTTIKRQHHECHFYKRFTILSIVLSALAIAGGFWAIRRVINKDINWRRQRSNRVFLMEEYIVDHPENVYVYDHLGCQNYSVFASFSSSQRKPTNGFAWGSSYIYTPAYYEQLAYNDLDSLYTEDLLRDNVYFISGTENKLKYKFMLEAMLMKEYSGVIIEEVDYIEDAFVVYKITKGVE